MATSNGGKAETDFGTVSIDTKCTNFHECLESSVGRATQLARGGEYAPFHIFWNFVPPFP